jgi:hypothetical protein
MRQGFSTVLFASAFVASSGFALAAGPNDAFNYPSAEAHKQYSAYRNQDHNNPSPRYAVTTTTNSEHPAYRNQDHNNPSPRYTATTQTPSRTAPTRSSRYLAHTMHGTATRHHG